MTDSIGVVPFVAAGGAFASTVPSVGSRTIEVGAGLGLRYYTAIGPIRLDVARGLNRDHFDPPYAIYISLGQSF